MPKIPHVYQDKKSKLWYFVANLGYDYQGKRIQHWGRGYKTQLEAKKGYEDYINNFSETAVKKNSTMDFKTFYDTYFIPDYKQSVRESTYSNRISVMNKHFKYFFNIKLKDINPPMIKKWQNTLSERYSPGYVRGIYIMFSQCLDLAVKLGLINKNIAKQVGNVKKQKQKVDFWTKEEAERVFQTFNLEDYYELFGFTLIYTLFMTGLRLGEAQALLWNDLIENEQTLIINKSMYYKSSDSYEITPPKTMSSNRIISLDDTTIKVLKKWRETQQKNIKTNFIFSFNGLPIYKSQVKRTITKHANKAGVHRIKVHALRHSHASLLISLGESALVVRDRLGHEDVKTTLSTYGHLYPNINKEVAKKLNNTFDIKIQ